MAYTHTMELVIDGNTVNGEVNFNGDEKPKIKLMNTPEFELNQQKLVIDMISKIICINNQIGEVEKIEFRPIVV